MDTAEGGAVRGDLTVGWHGADRAAAGDALFPNGAYDWTLSVRPLDGAGAPLETRGTVMLRGGGSVRHDHVGADAEPDGAGDLLTLNSSGGMTFQQGDGKGGFSGKSSASGWSTKALAVPFGDMDGALRGYRPECGQPLTPSAPYKKLGTGWNAYDVLTSRHKDGTLYRYAGKGDGTVKGRVEVFTDWGASYNAVVGVGDITGDGRADLVVRDTSGNLYRNDGKGNGSFTGRTKIAGGWGHLQGMAHVVPPARESLGA
ncbi:FG-GAP repeat domain-containing protein [Streptomyces sp. NPDC003006]